jgi:hypothetical protein
MRANIVALTVLPAICTGAWAQVVARPNAAECLRRLGYTAAFGQRFAYLKNIAPYPPNYAGYILEQDEKHVTLLTQRLETNTFEGPYFDLKDVIECDLSSWVPDFLKRETAELKGYVKSRETYDPDLELFFLSEACKANGLAELGAKALALSQQFDHATGGDYDREIVQRIDEKYVDELYQKFSNSKFSRQALLDSFKTYLSVFPDGPYSTKARADAATLERMVQQDANVAPQPTSEVGKIDALIFSLRDHFGNWEDPYMGIGGPSTFNFPRHNGPLEALEKYGYSAVPQLVTAITDATLTRNTTGSRRFQVPGVRVLTVGDICVHILGKIAGRSFLPQNDLPSAGDVAKTKSLVERWWSDVQAKGDKPLLIAEVIGDGSDVLTSAAKLVEKYPGNADGPIITALEREPSVAARKTLMAELAKCSTAAAHRELLKLMVHDPELDGRVDAAKLVLDFAPDPALQALSGDYEAILTNQLQRYPDVFSAIGLAETILELPGAGGIKFLEKNYERTPIQIRSTVIDNLGPMGMPWRPHATSPEATLRNQAKEHFLIQALADQIVVGESMSTGALELNAPRLCDLAVIALHTNWPSKYKQPSSTTRAELDSVRQADMNAWTSTQGLPSRLLLGSHRSFPAQVSGTPSEVSRLVREVVLEGPISEELKAPCTQVLDQRLSADWVVNTIVTILKNWPPKAGYLTFTIDREPGTLGLCVALVASPCIGGFNEVSYGINAENMADSESGGGGIGPEQAQGFRPAIERALSSSPLGAVHIRFLFSKSLEGH